MIVNRSHLPWAIFVALITLGCGALYVANFHPEALPQVHLPPIFGPVPPIRNTVGGTPLGLAFGTAGLLIFLFASALGIRKKRRLWRIGRVESWLRAHIWLTILTIPLVLLHCGFRHGGAMPSVLLTLYGIVMVSGFFGLGMQQFMPRLMTQSLPREVVYEQIPHIRRLLVENALKLRSELRTAARTVGATAAPPKAAAPSPAAVAAAPTATVVVPVAAADNDTSDQVLAGFMDDEGLAYLEGRRNRLLDKKISDDVFRLLRLSVSPKWQPRVEDLQLWCDDFRSMALQTKLHHWLHGWLLVHVPVSFALLVMTFWHAYITLIYL